MAFLWPGPHKHGDEKIYHAYYQWVPLMLTFQVSSTVLGTWEKCFDVGLPSNSFRLSSSISHTGSGRPWKEGGSR